MDLPRRGTSPTRALSPAVSPSVLSSNAAATSGVALPATGADITFGAWGGVALMLGILLVTISKQMTQVRGDPSILPKVRRSVSGPPFP